MGKKGMFAVAAGLRPQWVRVLGTSLADPEEDPPVAPASRVSPQVAKQSDRTPRRASRGVRSLTVVQVRRVRLCPPRSTTRR